MDQFSENTMTYFGLTVMQIGAAKVVPLSEIEALPFADFWKESAVGSTLLSNPETGEDLVYLHDWERFSRRFIETGKHRYSDRHAN